MFSFTTYPLRKKNTFIPLQTKLAFTASTSLFTMIMIISIKLIYFLLIILIFNQNFYHPVLSQLSGKEKTMEQFLDRLLHESVYDKRIRPFYTDNKSKLYNIYRKIIVLIFSNILFY